MMMHTDIRRALVERLTALLESHASLPLQLYPFQLETFLSMRTWLEDLGGTRRGYVEHATGLGKTVLFAALAGFCTDLRVLIVVPTLVLVEQTARATVKFTGGVLGYLGSLSVIKDDDGRVIAMRGHQYSNIVVTTDESLVRNPRRIAEEFNPHLVVFDECHWGYVGAAEWALRCFPEAVIIGFSATPDYLSTVARVGYVPVTLDNGQVLYAPPDRLAKAIFGTLIDRRTITWGISEGWLAPLAWGRIHFDVSLEGIPVRDGEAGLDYQASALTRHMGEHWSDMTRAILELYRQGTYGLPDRQVFAVCPSVAAAQELAGAIEDLGIPAASVTAHTPSRERNRVLRGYRENSVRLLTSVMVLREGWDAPNAEICLMLRPTRSRVVYVQTVGRVLRPWSNKVALVLDGQFADTTYEPLSAPALFVPVGQEVAMGDILIGAREGAPGSARSVAQSPYVSHGTELARFISSPIVVEHCAGKDGMLPADGEVWGTERALAQKLGVDTHYIKTWALRGGARSRTGKTHSGQVATFYALADVAAAASVTGYHAEVQSGAVAARAAAVQQGVIPAVVPEVHPQPAESAAAEVVVPAPSEVKPAIHRGEGKVLSFRKPKQKKASRRHMRARVLQPRFLPSPRHDPAVEELLARWEEVVGEVLAGRDIFARGGDTLHYEERLRRLIEIRKEIAALGMCRPLKVRRQPSRVPKRGETTRRRAWMR